MSFAEKEQKNTRQEFSFGDDHCVTRFNFFANYSLINTEKNTELLKKVPHREFLDLSLIYVVELGYEENINSPSFPHEYELIINNWENVKNSVRK